MGNSYLIGTRVATAGTADASAAHGRNHAGHATASCGGSPPSTNGELKVLIVAQEHVSLLLLRSSRRNLCSLARSRLPVGVDAPLRHGRIVADITCSWRASGVVEILVRWTIRHYGLQVLSIVASSSVPTTIACPAVAGR